MQTIFEAFFNEAIEAIPRRNTRDMIAASEEGCGVGFI
jgi:hypothetical protein